MRRSPQLLSLAALVLVLAGGNARAQTPIEDALKSLTGDNGIGYMQPLADLHGANTNAGWFHSASISRLGFHIELDFIGMGGIVGDDQKSYTATAPTGFTPATFNTATIFGGKGTVVPSSVNPGTSYRAPDGIFNTSIFPLVAPQLTIGDVFGTRAAVRYIFIPKLGEAMPEGKTWGFGIQHSISQWISVIPLDVAAFYTYGVTTVDWSEGGGRLFDCSGYSYGLQASKQFSVLTVYGALAAESSSMAVKYQSTDPSAPGTITLDLEGANKFRATAGVSLSLGFFKLFADANFGKVTQFTGGIGFGN
jgi:hypothetical protein